MSIFMMLLPSPLFLYPRLILKRFRNRVSLTRFEKMLFSSGQKNMRNAIEKITKEWLVDTLRRNNVHL